MITRISAGYRVDRVRLSAAIIELWLALGYCDRLVGLGVLELTAELEPYRDLFERWLRPAIWIHVDEPGRGNIGQSRISGTPDLPKSTPWPKNTGTTLDYLLPGAPLAYLLQINFAELPVDARTPALPKSGMLWLYEAWSSPEIDQLITYEGDEALVPSELLTESYYSKTVEPHTLRFRAGFDLPRWSSASDDKLRNALHCAIAGVSEDDLSEAASWRKDAVFEESDKLIQQAISLLRAGAFARFFGWTGGHGHDIHQDAEVHRLQPSAMHDYEARSKLDLSGAVSWRNLLTVHSHWDIELMIGDAGSTTVLIQDDDLELGDLSRCYVTNQSS